AVRTFRFPSLRIAGRGWPSANSSAEGEFGSGPMAERLIELRNITKSFGRVYALGGVNLSVDKGEVVGLIGDNGAGKSTLIKILAGVVKPTSGEILGSARGRTPHARDRLHLQGLRLALDCRPAFGRRAS